MESVPGHSARWAITSFEASGDQLAQRCLASLPASIHWVGIEERSYSDQLKTSIALPKVFQHAYGTMGVFGFLRRWFGLRSACKTLGDQLLQADLVGIVLVDFPSLHVRLAKYLKSRQPGLKIVYLAPPKTWASRSGRLAILRRYVDQLVTIFDYEYQYFKQLNFSCLLLKSPWVNGRFSQTIYPKKNALKDQMTRILIYPGSRRQEINRHMKVAFQALRLLQSVQGVQVDAYISLPQDLWAKRYGLTFWHLGAKKSGRTFLPSKELSVTWICDEWMPIDENFVAWVCSGTMTAKVATWGIPMVVMYGLDWISYAVLRFVYRSFLAIPNIAVHREVYPELVGPKLTPRSLVQAHVKVSDAGRREEFRKLSQSFLVRQAQGMSWTEGFKQIVGSETSLAQGVSP